MDVVLANLPFAHTGQPSLAFSLFKPILQGQGYTCSVLYPNLRFADDIGRDLYSQIAGYYPQTDYLLGELLFSQFLNGIDLGSYFNGGIDLGPYTSGLYLDALPDSVNSSHRKHIRTYLNSLSTLSAKITQFVDQTAVEILNLNPRMVGLTSIFQQHTATLSVAKRLRQLSPDLIIVLGGSNCECEMGARTAAIFDTLDFVVSGAGEVALLGILGHVLRGEPAVPLNGVYPTRRRSSHPQPRKQVGDERVLDDLPYPDYSDYFRTLEELQEPYVGDMLLPFEGSRGCWWGAKNHCTFCGLNGSTMQMRQKSGPRALAELRHLSSMYPQGKIAPVDNIIPMNWFKDVLPSLAEQPIGPMFYEVKVNLKPDQLELLRKAQVVELQPGIESLSDRSLDRMKKGTSSLKNVQFLLKTKQLGITVYWNLLFGFPGEDASEYGAQLAIIRSISHLPPPVSTARVRIDRFSPLYMHGDAFGVKNIRPVEAYNYIYPEVATEDRLQLAYYFDADYTERHMFEEERAEIRRLVEQWKKLHPRCYLSILRTSDGKSVLVDTRIGTGPRAFMLDPLDLYLLQCSKILDRALAEQAAFQAFPNGNVSAALDYWIGQHCILRVGNNVLSVVEAGGDSATIVAALAIAQEQCQEAGDGDRSSSSVTARLEVPGYSRSTSEARKEQSYVTC